MDPLHAWKDDFEREVEEVLAGRARARERGEELPEESFGFTGRLSDLVIPPAGTYAELREAQKNLELARAEIAELRERVDVRQRALEREKDSRERLKDGITRLALAVREERAGREMAQEEVKKTWGEMEVAKRFLAAARIDAEHADARAEDWERESLARQRAARDLQARLERLLLDSDAKEAEVSSLQARLAAAQRRAAETAASDPLTIRLDQEKKDAQKIAEAATAQCERVMASERTAQARLALLEDELRLQTARNVDLESKVNELVADAARAREEKAAVERDAREGSQASYREGVEAARKRVEAAENALAEARRIGEVAVEKERKAVEALTTLKVQIKMKMEKLLAATLDERDRKDKAIADLLRAEALAMERVAMEKTHRESILEEARAKMRAEFEEQRAALEKEMDAERDSMRKRWQEQADALASLRKEIEGGRKEG